MGEGRVLGRVPDDHDVKRGAEPVDKRLYTGEYHAAARRYKQGAKAEAVGQVAVADGLGRRRGAFPPRSGLVVCRACSPAWGCKSPTQPDGGEVLAKRKGVVARRRLKEARSQTAT
jgi:hypothetical protein